MANTLTGLIQYVYDTVDVVGRELVGMIPSVYLNPKAEMVAKDQDITYDIVPTMAAEDTTPAATPPALGDQSVGTGTMKITKSRTVRFYWSGDDEAKMGTTIKNAVENNKFAQAFRTLTNEMEVDLAALHLNASRAYASHATTPIVPFGTAGDFSDAAQVAKILKDNGCPMSDMQLVLNTAAGANLIGKQAQAHIAGTDSIQRQGIILKTAGFNIRESAQIVSTLAVGTNTGPYAINGAHAAGATTITLKTGTGTILAGDVITIGTDTVTKYVVLTGCAAAGDITINAPGLTKALAGNEAIAVVGTCSRSMAFDRSAIPLLARLPKLPTGGDAAVDEYIMVDPLSGLPFRIALYKGYHANQIAISCAWGVKAVKPPNIALLLGQ